MKPAANNGATLADTLDRCLPQTQCTRCGYPSCRDYAEAMAAGSAAGNRCPPGGEETIRRLSVVLGTTPCAPDPQVGPYTERGYALIDEQQCIGCTLCIPACPLDAIVGAAKRMHTVILDRCSGCGLCVAPCPMDCIALLPMPAPPSPSHDKHPWPDYTEAEATRFRTLKQRHDERISQRDADSDSDSPTPAPDTIQDEIRRAVARTRARRADSKERRPASEKRRPASDHPQ